MDFNINGYVFVRLTPIGRKRFDAYYEDFGFDPHVYAKMHKQKGGTWRFQLHELMNIFGPTSFIGMNPSFVDNIIHIPIEKHEP